MLISRTSQYAIQSLIYIATQKQKTPILSREIAERLFVPSAYLAKIMQSLCKGGLLTSFRGRLGGFCLRETPDKIDLKRILMITEGADFTKDCLLGLKECSDETACAWAGSSWALSRRWSSTPWPNGRSAWSFAS